MVSGVLASVLGIGLAYSRGPLGPPLARQKPRRARLGLRLRSGGLWVRVFSWAQAPVVFSHPPPLATRILRLYCVVSSRPEARVWLVRGSWHRIPTACLGPLTKPGFRQIMARSGFVNCAPAPVTKPAVSPSHHSPYPLTSLEGSRSSEPLSSE